MPQDLMIMSKCSVHWAIPLSCFEHWILKGKLWVHNTIVEARSILVKVSIPPLLNICGILWRICSRFIFSFQWQNGMRRKNIPPAVTLASEPASHQTPTQIWTKNHYTHFLAVFSPSFPSFTLMSFSVGEFFPCVGTRISSEGLKGLWCEVNA